MIMHLIIIHMVYNRVATNIKPPMYVLSCAAYA